MTSTQIAEAVVFAKNHSQINEILSERDADDNLILMGASCKKTLYEGGNEGYFLRVIFDYKIKNQRNTPAPDVFIDLEYVGGNFRALPRL